MTQAIGEPVHGFEMPALEGARASLDGVLAGHRGAVVVFWSGVCSHCVRYDAYLNGFGAAHPELALLAVASRQQETAVELERTARGRGLRFPILHDPDQRLAHAWLVQQTPRAFLVDAGRRLVYRGAIDNFKYPQEDDYQPYLEDAIADFLAGRPPRRPETSSFGCPIESVYYELPKPLGPGS